MDEEKLEQFRRSIKYRDIGFFIILCSVLPMILVEGVYKYVVTLIVFGIGVWFERQYKCPFCGYVFDPRLKVKELVYCQHCSQKLQHPEAD